MHSYDAFHTRSDMCERHHRNAQVQNLSCRCLVVVLLWCENTISVKYRNILCYKYDIMLMLFCFFMGKLGVN